MYSVYTSLMSVSPFHCNLKIYYVPCIVLQETEVSSVKYIFWADYKSLLANGDEEYVPYDVSGQYSLLFDVIEQRYCHFPLLFCSFYCNYTLAA